MCVYVCLSVGGCVLYKCLTQYWVQPCTKKYVQIQMRHDMLYFKWQLCCCHFLSCIIYNVLRDSCRPPQSMRKLFKSSLGILPEGVTAYWKPRCGQVSREDQSKPWAGQRRKDLKLCQPHERKVTGSLRMAPVAPRRCHLSREKTAETETNKNLKIQRTCGSSGVYRPDLCSR